MKSKLILGLATIAALTLPAVAQNSYCYTDRDGDQQTCVTNYNNNGYYGNQYAPTYQYSPSYTYPGYYGNNYYRGHDRDYWRHREHEEHERQEHQRHELREHHRDRDWDR
jgi:hypothetical protein